MKAGTKCSTVVGVFQDRAHAQQAVNELRRLGFREDEIGVAVRDGETIKGAKDVTASNVGTGAAAGVATGAGLGALWGLGIVAGVLPAIGPAIAGGTLATILSSAAAGAAAAGITGALIGLGIPEEEATFYEDEFKAGRTIVTVKSETRCDEARAVLNRFSGYDMRTRGTGYATATATCATAAGTADSSRKIQVKEEELRVHKQPVETGEVRIHKEVHTEHKTLEVPVKKEEVVIERHSVAGKPVSGQCITQGEEIRIPVREEQVHVEKQPVVKEEITVEKRQVQGTEQVAGSVRKEDVRVEKKGDVDVKHRDRR